MRLLSKRAADEAKALDRQREIEEGKKLATRVDKLRELSAEEEKNIRQFRDRELASIMTELKPLREELETTKHLIAHRKDELKVLMQPIDEKWADIDRAQTALNEWADDLEQTALRQKQTDTALAQERESLDDGFNNLQAREAAHQFKVNEIDDMHHKAKEVLAQARNDAQTMEMQVAVRNAELNQRDEVLKERERKAEEKEVQNLEVRKVNIAEAIRLADMRKTLEKYLN